MGICALLSLVTGLLYARFAARAAYGWGARIREVQYQKVQGFAFSNLDHFESSSLVTRMTTDVTVLQNAVNGGFRPMVRGPVMLVMGVGLSFWMNPTLALVFLVCAPLLGAALFYILRKIAPLYSLLQRAVDRLNGVVQEGLTAIRAVKAFVRGEYEEEKFQEVNTSLMETSQENLSVRGAEPACVSAGNVCVRHPHYVVWRQYDSKFHAPSGGADWVPELRFPGYELNDDDLQRAFCC
mgnify:CR=1 FL=1